MQSWDLVAIIAVSVVVVVCVFPMILTALLCVFYHFRKKICWCCEDKRLLKEEEMREDRERRLRGVELGVPDSSGVSQALSASAATSSPPHLPQHPIPPQPQTSAVIAAPVRPEAPPSGILPDESLLRYLVASGADRHEAYIILTQTKNDVNRASAILLDETQKKQVLEQARIQGWRRGPGSGQLLVMVVGGSQVGQETGPGTSCQCVLSVGRQQYVTKSVSATQSPFYWNEGVSFQITDAKQQFLKLELKKSTPQRSELSLGVVFLPLAYLLVDEMAWELKVNSEFGAGYVVVRTQAGFGYGVENADRCVGLMNQALGVNGRYQPRPPSEVVATKESAGRNDLPTSVVVRSTSDPTNLRASPSSRTPAAILTQGNGDVSRASAILFEETQKKLALEHASLQARAQIQPRVVQEFVQHPLSSPPSGSVVGDSGRRPQDHEQLPGYFPVREVPTTGRPDSEQFVASNKPKTSVCCVRNCTMKAGALTSCLEPGCELRFHKRHARKSGAKVVRRKYCPNHEKGTVVIENEKPKDPVEEIAGRASRELEAAAFREKEETSSSVDSPDSSESEEEEEKDWEEDWEESDESSCDLSLGQEEEIHVSPGGLSVEDIAANLLRSLENF